MIMLQQQRMQLASRYNAYKKTHRTGGRVHIQSTTRTPQGLHPKKKNFPSQFCTHAHIEQKKKQTPAVVHITTPKEKYTRYTHLHRTKKQVPTKCSKKKKVTPIYIYICIMIPHHCTNYNIYICILIYTIYYNNQFAYILQYYTTI